MLRRCQIQDIENIYIIVNDAAKAYQGVIPPDCYHEPYMSVEELVREMQQISFFGWQDKEQLVGIMGIQRVRDVTLIRHAYVLPPWQKRGIGSQLLNYLKGIIETQWLLVGTWASARWAIAFYQEHGFCLLPDKDKLLRSYWGVPQRQVETSVVLGIDLFV